MKREKENVRHFVAVQSKTDKGYVAMSQLNCTRSSIGWRSSVGAVAGLLRSGLIIGRKERRRASLQEEESNIIH
jgi:hypothetical protein